MFLGVVIMVMPRYETEEEPSGSPEHPPIGVLAESRNMSAIRQGALGETSGFSRRFQRLRA